MSALESQRLRLALVADAGAEEPEAVLLEDAFRAVSLCV